MNPHLTPLLVFIAVPACTALAAVLFPAPRAGGAALGRQVYIAEGCIHCHSQYIRPDTADVDWWGEPRPPAWSRAQTPALIGNRRQGPDLMNAGLRLPRDWQERHLIDPRSVMPASRMPSYAHLFAPGDPRGPALLDYLATLGREPATAGQASAP